MVQSLKPLDDLYGIKRVDVSTYQAASGAGKEGMEELVQQMQDFFAFKLDETEVKAFAHRLALNVIPHIDVPQSNGFTKEEMKMVNETQKIMHKKMEISATCVRVPVYCIDIWHCGGCFMPMPDFKCIKSRKRSTDGR